MQPDLGIAQRSKGVKQRANCLNPPLGVGINEGVPTNCSTKKLEIPLQPRGTITAREDLGQQVRHQVSMLELANCNHLAFGGIQSQAQGSTTRLNMAQSSTNGCHIPRNDAIVQIEKSEVQRPGSEFLSELVNGCSKQQWSQAICFSHRLTR